MNEWISVKDRLPEERRWVVILYKYGTKPDIAMFIGSVWVDAGFKDIDCTITHWLPIPEYSEHADA